MATLPAGTSDVMPAATVVACVGTHCSMNLASSGPQMTRVGAATRSPKSRVSPRSAPSASIATSGPGWGGTRPCRIDRPARAGIPTRMIGMSRRRATRITTGTSRTTPTSKNSGSPSIAAIRAIAQGSPAGPTRPMIVSTIVSLPPESASSLPTIAPSAINRPTDPTVAPNPRVKLLTMSRGATPATAPITAVPSISARNGWNFARVIKQHHGGDAEDGGQDQLAVGGVGEIHRLFGGQGHGVEGHELSPSGAAGGR